MSKLKNKNHLAEMEEAIRFFRLFAERSRSVFWVRDVSLNKQIYVSPAYEQIWGRPCETLYKDPNSWIETVIPEDRNNRTVETRLGLLANHGTAAQYEERFRIKRPDGTIVWIKDTHFPIQDKEGRFIGFAGISDDITKDVMYEQELTDAKQRAETANLAKSEFLAMMSHELRTPLNAILGMTQILKKKGLSEELNEYVDIINHSGNNLLVLVSDILDFVRIESWTIKIINKSFHLEDLLSKTVHSLYYQATEKGLALELDFPKNMPQAVIGDANRIRQIMINLLNNAIKFTETGGIKISVECTKQSKTKGLFIFTVTDTGIGIHEDNQAYIFEKFSQVESSYQRKHQGVGLGLAIVKELVEKMGGTIQVKSKLGEGSQFIVNLPLKLQKKQLVTPRKKIISNAHIKAKITRPYKILLVEDNAINQKIAKIMLEDLGCHIDMVDCGRDALTQLEKKSYDVIFMDIGLPDMSGFEVVKKIRGGKQKSNIPIIAMTAHILERDRKKALKAGMDSIIVKPINQDDISKTLIEMLG